MMKSTTARHRWTCRACATPVSTSVWATVDRAEHPELFSADLTELAATCPACGVPAFPAPSLLVENLFQDAPLVWFTEAPPGDGDDSAATLHARFRIAFGPFAPWAGTIITAPRQLLGQVASLDMAAHLQQHEPLLSASRSDYATFLNDIEAHPADLRIEAGLRGLFEIASRDDLAALVERYPELRTEQAEIQEQRCQRHPGNWHPPAISSARSAVLASLGEDDVAGAWQAFQTIMDDFIETDLEPLRRANAEITAIRSSPSANLAEAIDKHLKAARIAAHAGIHADEADHRSEVANLLLTHQTSPDDLDTAISLLEQAADLYERCGQPAEAARCRVNLAMALMQRSMLAEGKTNTAAALHHLEAALEFFDETEKPEEWACAQTNLAYVLLHRYGDTKADAIRAVAACRAALRVRSVDNNRIEFVYTQVNLGHAYTVLAAEDKGYAQSAIDAFQAALDHIDQDNEEQLWAQAHHDAGVLYRDLARDQPERYLAEAERHADEVLRHRNRDADPVSWGFACRLMGEVIQIKDGVTAALPWFEQALAVLTPSVAPYDCVPLASRIGSIHAANENWQAAADAYQVAVTAAQQIPAREHHPDAVPDPTVWRWACYLRVRAALASNDAELRSKQLTMAVETIERGRARELRSAITDPTEAITISDIRRPVDAGSCVVYLVASPAGACALVVSGEDVAVVDAPLLTSTRVIALITGFDIKKAEVLDASYLLGLHTDDSSLTKALDRALSEIGPRLMQPVAAATNWASRVTLIPCGPLGLLPLHAAEWVDADSERRCLLDLIPVAYAPSALLLDRAQRATTENQATHMVGIGDPSGQESLPGAKAEMSEIEILFHGDAQIRYGKEATKGFLLQALPTATHLHLACHGTARQGYPLESALHLADGATLTLEEILTNVSLDVRLVVTAACHSGSFDILHDPDEVLGLPAGLLAVGAGGVVAALWAVDDDATALLMTRFYEILVAGTEPASALRAAQLWLRDLTRKDRRMYLTEHPNLRRELQRSTRIYWRLPGLRHPYRSVEYWAAFALFGH